MSGELKTVLVPFKELQKKSVKSIQFDEKRQQLKITADSEVLTYDIEIDINYNVTGFKFRGSVDWGSR